ncbi:hypothetical protein [Paenibacillus humicus]|uniref:hypothetical protein n=1 Tax=Paenibacillus humicus TaxID=412861 RepID=UPI003F187EA0
MNLEKLATAQSLDIEINIETDDIFDHRQSVKEGKRLIKILNENLLIENDHHKEIEFVHDRWVIYNSIGGMNETLEFSFVEKLSFIKHADINMLKDALKCWVIDRLVNDQLVAATVELYFNHVKEAILRTHVFIQNGAENYFENMQALEWADYSKRQKIFSVLNFLSYYNDIDPEREYTQILYRLLNNLKDDRKSRMIPSGLNILRFSNILEDFYKTEDKKSKDYLHYFPILLWWKITTIIPLRPFEFCAIAPDCLIFEDSKCYLRLPRLKNNQIKRKNKNRKQIIDKILIPKQIEDLISEYTTLIEVYEHQNRKTLVSRKVYNQTLPSRENGHSLRRSNTAFLSPDLYVLIERFYANIVNKRYGLTYSHLPPVGRKSKNEKVEKEQTDLVRVRPIDSRHIAFINMLAQGWSKPEIARFGGHLVLETQANYQNHQEYWIEVETRKMMQNFKLGLKVTPSIKQDDESENVDSFSLSIRLDAAFKKKFILRPPATQTKKKLKIGYCTDPLQLCKTHCFHCDFWRITLEEFEERGDELRAFINECDSSIQDLLAFLKDLNRFVFEEELNPEIAEKILSTQKKIDDEIYKRASLLYNLDRSLVM